jgi:hypothetical protein
MGQCMPAQKSKKNDLYSKQETGQKLNQQSDCLIVKKLPGTSYWDTRPSFEGGAMIDFTGGTLIIAGQLYLSDGAEQDVNIEILDERHQDDFSYTAFVAGCARSLRICAVQNQHKKKIIPACYCMCTPNDNVQWIYPEYAKCIVTEIIEGPNLTDVIETDVIETDVIETDDDDYFAADNCDSAESRQNRRTIALRVVAQMARNIIFLRSTMPEENFFFDLPPTNVRFTDDSCMTAIMKYIGVMETDKKELADQFDTNALINLLFYCVAKRLSAALYLNDLKSINRYWYNVDDDIAALIIDCTRDDCKKHHNAASILERIERMPIKSQQNSVSAIISKFSVNALISLLFSKNISISVLNAIKDSQYTGADFVNPDFMNCFDEPVRIQYKINTLHLSSLSDVRGKLLKSDIKNFTIKKSISISDVRSNELIMLLISKNIAAPILSIISADEYTGRDFSNPDFFDIFDEATCVVYGIKQLHISTLRNVREKLLRSDEDDVGVIGCLSSEKLKILLRYKNIAESILSVITDYKYTGVDFANSEFLNSFDNDTCRHYDITPSQLTTLCDVRIELLDSIILPTVSTSTIDKMTTNELCLFLIHKNIADPILCALHDREYKGVDFVCPNFMDFFGEGTCARYNIKLLHLSTLNIVHKEIIATM